MLGFLTALAIAYFGIRYVRRNHGGRRFRRRRREWILDRLSSRLDTRPSQDAVLEGALDDVMNAFDEEKRAFRSTKSTVARILQSDDFDAGALDELLASQREALGRVQAAVAESLAKAHETLDPGQRARLAAHLERRGHGCRRAVAAA